MATPRLTPRERQILCLIFDCLRYRDIATELHISVPTVKMHVQNLLHKHGCQSRLQLAALAHPTRNHRQCGAAANAEPLAQRDARTG